MKKRLEKKEKEEDKDPNAYVRTMVDAHMRKKETRAEVQGRKKIFEKKTARTWRRRHTFKKRVSSAKKG